MAATLTPDGELTYFSFPIEKSEETAEVNPVDGTPDLIVYGKATDGSVDSDLQIVDQDWSAKAIREWLDTGGNLRVQHQARRDPAGVGLSVNITPDGHFVKALVAEPAAKNLVRIKALRDFSVGISLPDINPDPTGKAMNGIITGRRDGLTKISEISLVDRGSNFNSGFQLVKAAGDGAPEFVGKMFGGMVDYLNEHPPTQSEPRRSEYPVGGLPSPADVAKMLTGHDGVAKRQKELGVTDEEKAVEPGVIPEQSAEVAKADDEVQVDKAGVPPQFAKEDDEKDDDDSKSDKPASDKAAKPDDDDEKDDEDEDTGEDAVTDKSVEVVLEKTVGIEKKDKVLCPGCGANVHAIHKFCAECGGSLKDAMGIKKNHDFTCLGCGLQLDKGEKFCPECGKAHPGYLPAADSKVKAAGDEGDANGGPSKVVGDDGSADEAKLARKAAKKAAKIEAVKAVDTEPEPVVEERRSDTTKMFVPGDFEASASMRLKMLGVPLDYGVLHDLTCPAYHPDDVAKSYPRYDLATLDANRWQAKAFDMAASAPLDQARMANQLWQAVVTLKNTDPRDLAEVRSDLYKEFSDANPGPGSFPSPGALHAGSFNRSLVTAGHEAPSPGHDGPNTSPQSFGEISAAQFDRGYLTGGHADDGSSGTRSQVPVNVPVATGVPTRTHYTNAQRNNARQAMVAMHDHIAQTFPDLCPTHMDVVPHANPAPVGVGKAKKAKKNTVGIENPTVVVEGSVVDKTIDLSKAAAPTVVDKAAVLDLDAVQALITKAVSDANAAHQSELANVQKELKKTRKQLNAIADQPDPNGPYRGVAFEQVQIAKTAAPEVLPSVSRVERTQEALFRTLHDQWRNSPDPMQREVAYRELCKMSGIGNTPMYK